MPIQGSGTFSRTDQNLTDIPSDIPVTATKIDLSRNRLTGVKYGAFKLTFIGKVVMRDHATGVSLLLSWEKKKSVNNIEVGNQHVKLHKHKRQELSTRLF